MINLRPSFGNRSRGVDDPVKQWEFTPTPLNGVPEPVIMTVTVQFTLAR